jgi:radical SAM-linked protein
MESAQEFVDITAQEYPADLVLLKSEINRALPPGMEILEIRALATGEKALAQALRGFVYELYLPDGLDSGRMKAIKENVGNFLAEPSFNIQRLSKGKTITRDIRPFIESIVLDAGSKKIDLILSHAQQGSARPVDIINHVLGFDAGQTSKIRVVKTRTILN